MPSLPAAIWMEVHRLGFDSELFHEFAVAVVLGNDGSSALNYFEVKAAQGAVSIFNEPRWSVTCQNCLKK